MNALLAICSCTFIYAKNKNANINYNSVMDYKPYL